MIYLMRHGLDDERFIGGYSNNHLTNEGVRSVCQARDYIVNKGLVINKIFTSDILRAIETADIVNTKLHVPVIQMKYLRELDKGLLNGLNLEIANIYYNEWMNVKDIYKRFPEGESLSDLYNRILYYYHDILKEDNIINKIGLKIPFMIDLSVKLQDYDLISEMTLDMNGMVNKLWK